MKSRSCSAYWRNRVRASRTRSLAIWLNGDDVRVALHARAGREPLVLSARVERGDAETGFGLAFQDVTEAATDYLAEMLGDLPSIEGPEADDVQLVVSELIPAELQPD